MSGKQAAIWFVIVSLIFVGYLYIELVDTPRKVRHTMALKRVASVDVEQIRISPTGQLNSISYEATVTDPLAIERIVGLLADSWPHRPSHPVSQWECRIEIVMDSESWRLKLVDAGRQGFLAYVESGQILSSEGLGAIKDLIETTERSQASAP